MTLEEPAGRRSSAPVSASRTCQAAMGQDHCPVLVLTRTSGRRSRLVDVSVVAPADGRGDPVSPPPQDSVPPADRACPNLAYSSVLTCMGHGAGAVRPLRH